MIKWNRSGQNRWRRWTASERLHPNPLEIANTYRCKYIFSFVRAHPDGRRAGMCRRDSHPFIYKPWAAIAMHRKWHTSRIFSNIRKLHRNSLYSWKVCRYSENSNNWLVYSYCGFVSLYMVDWQIHCTKQILLSKGLRYYGVIKYEYHEFCPETSHQNQYDGEVVFYIDWYELCENFY